MNYKNSDDNKTESKVVVKGGFITVPSDAKPLVKTSIIWGTALPDTSPTSHTQKHKTVRPSAPRTTK